MRPFFATLALSLLGAVFGKSVSATPPIKTSLQASWPASPLILEVLELVGSSNSEAYFEALDKIATDDQLRTGSSRYVHEAFFDQDVLGRYREEEDLMKSVDKVSIATRIYAPAVQAYFHFYNASVVPRMNENNEQFNNECDNWIEWYGDQFCNMDKFASFIKTDVLKKLFRPQPRLLAFDHILSPTENESSLYFIFYGDVTSQEFSVFHQGLKSLSKKFSINYVFRYKPGKTAMKTLYISGFGVELALKSTEYKVIDDQKVGDEPGSNDEKTKADPPKNDSSSPYVHGFNFDQLLKEFPDKQSELTRFQTLLLRESELEPKVRTMKSYELIDIGYKTAYFILKSPFPLLTLRIITQDFPKFVAFMSTRPVSERLKKEVASNQRLNMMGFPEQEDVVYINGLRLDPDKMDLFRLHKIVSIETSAARSLIDAGFSKKEVKDLLLLPTKSEQVEEEQQDIDWGEMYDIRDKKVVTESKSWLPTLWWNNLEKDKRYKGWPASLAMLMQPAYGGLPRVRKNVFNIIMFLDFTSTASLNYIQDATMYIQRFAPLRFGFVPIVDDKGQNDEKYARAFYFIFYKYGLKVMNEFVENLLATFGDKHPLEATLEKAFKKTLTGKKMRNDNDVPSSDDFEKFVLAQSQNEELDQVINEAKSKTSQIGLDNNERKSGVMFVNGMFVRLDENYQESMLHKIEKTLQFLQYKIYTGAINNQVDILDYMSSLPHVSKRRNFLINPSETNPLKIANLGDVFFLKAVEKLSGQYIGQEGAAITLWILSNLNEERSRQLAKDALMFMDSSSDISMKTRTVVIPCSKNAEEANDDSSKYIVKDQAFAKSICTRSMVSDSHSWIIVNGRSIGPISETTKFDQADFVDLLQKEYDARIKVIYQYFEKSSEKSNLADKTLIASSVINSASIKHAESNTLGVTDSTKISRIAQPSVTNRPKSSFEMGIEENAFIHAYALIDPLKNSAQKVAPLFEVLSSIKNSYIAITLNPSTITPSELPIKRFYRYVTSTELEFDSYGEIKAPSAIFDSIPVEPLLTLGLDIIQPWVVAPFSCVYDLDNIRLSDLLNDDRSKQKGIVAKFVLQSILVEGHAQDMTLQQAPRGIQFILGTNSYPSLVDTIVMANLGYFQLKANPGVWKLRIREGRSSDFYSLESAMNNGITAYASNGSVEVLVTNFEGALIYPKVRKNPEFLKEDVLEEPKDDRPGFWQSWFGGEQANKSTNAEINIFSVASGHLYERFLRIMILSVLKHTKSSVKFWFIENFLSPSFKESIPAMAKKYGFQVEMVTYKWPSWLRYQREKQRLIWAYKILFLDVLFPLSLDKVIFVDADQIVRTDLKELVDLDLHGAPYGYTPFCMDRREIDGFRFWTHGYWKDHLQGRPYHISALYVVDLVRFRQMAAGDRLRQQYQMLSADPNSLANLDQDLPNNMIHTVPIFSLPQEWLWCETWCSDESLTKAKTIDLCNNPMTKEPKLERAKRLLPEWTVYDEEARQFIEQWRQQQNEGSKTTSAKGTETLRHDEL